MTVESIIATYADKGVSGLIIIAFFVLVWWVVKKSNEREEKLCAIIDKLSDELPQLRETINKTNDSIDRIERRLDDGK